MGRSGAQVTDYSADLLQQLAYVGITGFEREHRFHPTRKWRFDLADPARMIALEIEGGVWVRGRHTRSGGFIGDCEKYAEATLLGWQVYRFPSDWVTSGRALEYVEMAYRRVNNLSLA